MMGASATRAPPGRFAPRVQGEKMGLIPLGVGGSRSKYVHDLGAWPKRSQGSHLPQLLPLGNLGQPVSLTLESSAKSSCCSSVFWSHSDPVLPPTQVPPHPRTGNVFEITLQTFPQWGWGRGLSLASRTLDSIQHGWGSCRPQLLLAFSKLKCWPQPPHSCSSS